MSGLEGGHIFLSQSRPAEIIRCVGRSTVLGGDLTDSKTFWQHLDANLGVQLNNLFMKTKGDLDPTEATAAHTITPADFIWRKLVLLSAGKPPASRACSVIILRVGSCLRCGPANHWD